MHFAGKEMKVMFAVPAYRKIDCIPFLDSLEATTKLFLSRGIECAFEMYGGCCIVQLARNELADKFLKSDCDKLFFFDDDVSWDAEGALAVVLSERQFVGGVYPVKDNEGVHAPFPVVLRCSEEGIPLCDGPFLRAVRTVGGFTCVGRSVFEKVRGANPQLSYQKQDMGDWEKFEERFDFFPQGVRGGKWIGEDYAFCDLWTGIGGDIYIVPDITFGHHRNGKAWYGNLWRYIKQLPGGVDHGKGTEKALWRDEANAGDESRVA